MLRTATTLGVGFAVGVIFGDILLGRQRARSAEPRKGGSTGGIDERILPPLESELPLEILQASLNKMGSMKKSSYINADTAESPRPYLHKMLTIVRALEPIIAATNDSGLMTLWSKLARQVAELVEEEVVNDPDVKDAVGEIHRISEHLEAEISELPNATNTTEKLTSVLSLLSSLFVLFKK